MIELNIRSLTHMTKLFAKDMAKRGKSVKINGFKNKILTQLVRIMPRKNTISISKF